MTLQLSERVESIKQSPSIAARKRVMELQEQGLDIVDFTQGEPDFDTPAFIVEAAHLAATRGDTHYTPSAGVPRLRTLLAQKLSADTHAAITPSQVVVGTGAKQLIYEAFMATLNPGDEVIVPAPYWVSYPDMAKLAGGVPVVVPGTEANGFKVQAADLAKAITPRTRWVILNSPSNPSGAVYTREDIQALARVLAAHPQVMIMTDDIYEYLVYDGRRPVNVAEAAPELLDRCLFINGFSKGYAMTGWRVGYAVGPVTLINAITKLIGQSTTCVSSISQAAAIAALEGPQTAIEDMRRTYEHRRNVMHAALSAIPGIRCSLPDGAFYLFPNVAGLLGKRTPQGKRLDTDLDLVLYLLEQGQVAVMDGTSYGMSPYLRLSYATSLERIEQGCKQLRTACEQLEH